MKEKWQNFIVILWHHYQRRSLRLLIALMTLGGIFQHLQAAPLDPHKYRLGANPLTEEQIQEIEANWPHILGVKPNKYGRARIEASLEERHLPAISIEAAQAGEDEFITNKDVQSQDPISIRGFAYQLQEGISALPSAVDNSKLPCFPPIGNQRSQGSCVAWATTYYHATHEYGLVNGINNKTDLKNVLSPKWCYNMINSGRDGGAWPPVAYDLLAKNGAVPYPNFPYDLNYTQWDLNPQDWITAMSYRMQPPTIVKIDTPQDVELVKQILNNGHILTFTTFARSWVMTKVGTDPSSSSNPYAGQHAISWMNGRSGGHQVTLVGYNDDIWIDVNGNGQVDPGEKGAFLVANSWGNWANNGFVWVSYDAFFKTSLVPNGPGGSGRYPIAEVGMIYSIVAKAVNYTPKLVAKFSLTQSERNQISMGIGVSETNTTSPASSVTSGALSEDGGALAFDGGTPRDLTATFALDLSDMLSCSDCNKRYYLLATDLKSGKPTVLNSYSVVDLVHNKEVANTTTPLTFDIAKVQPYVDYYFSSDQNVDTTPPTVNITSPTDGATLSGNINVTANASDNVGVQRVDFYIDSTLQAADVTAPYVWTVDTAKLANGQHTFTAIAYDAAGNSAKHEVKVNINNQAPPASIFINAGGGNIKDTCYSNTTWQEDKYYVGGIPFANYDIPDCMGPFQTVRYARSKFSYDIPVENGDKTVLLNFAEIYFRESGKRVFHVDINGQRVISNLDVFKQVGFGNPLQYRFPVKVTDNRVKIDFIPAIENPNVSAIGIISN